MKILITGAGGFLGFEIAKMLVAENYEVINFSRSHHQKLDQFNIKTRIGDLRNAKDVKRALKGIDAIFHVAALAGIWGKKEDFFSINFEGTKNIVLAAKKMGIRKLIYTSTPSVVFGNVPLCGVDETTPYPDKFYTYYAHSKRLAEEFVLKSNAKNFLTCAIRPHLIWGEGDPHIFPRLKEKAISGRLKIIGEGDNLVDVIHVKNAAYAHVLAFKNISEHKINGEAYFVGQERPVNLWDFINQMLGQTKIPPIKSKVSFKIAYALGLIFEKTYLMFGISREPPLTRFVAMQLSHSHYFSHKKAIKDFSYKEIVTIEDGLKGLS